MPFPAASREDRQTWTAGVTPRQRSVDRHRIDRWLRHVLALQPAQDRRLVAITRGRDIIYVMADILIRSVPDEVVAALDANAERAGLTRAEYLRRVLADQGRPPVTREQLSRFAERTADLADPEVMAAAWR